MLSHWLLPAAHGSAHEGLRVRSRWMPVGSLGARQRITGPAAATVGSRPSLKRTKTMRMSLQGGMEPQAELKWWGAVQRRTEKSAGQPAPTTPTEQGHPVDCQPSCERQPNLRMLTRRSFSTPLPVSM